MEIILQLVVAALLAWWAYSVAKKNGRDTTLAAVLGFLFGIFAVVGYYIAGKKETLPSPTVPSVKTGGAVSRTPDETSSDVPNDGTPEKELPSSEVED